MENQFGRLFSTVVQGDFLVHNIPITGSAPPKDFAGESDLTANVRCFVELTSYDVGIPTE